PPDFVVVLVVDVSMVFILWGVPVACGAPHATPSALVGPHSYLGRLLGSQAMLLGYLGRSLGSRSDISKSKSNANAII
ncbi:MAG TPA: hypothetical protein VKD19_04000, partial [Pseudolabrys sp.]|nr:hypothetical protein [Pseudolabrys sp.]